MVQVHVLGWLGGGGCTCFLRSFAGMAGSVGQHRGRGLWEVLQTQRLSLKVSRAPCKSLILVKCGKTFWGFLSPGDVTSDMASALSLDLWDLIGSRYMLITCIYSLFWFSKCIFTMYSSVWISSQNDNFIFFCLWNFNMFMPKKPYLVFIRYQRSRMV